ncbi:hypothetical protein QFZ46_000211 [Microbacterium murale]|uniref:TIR domain-containing protein n=2 Tax=Microbacterium murale TaxID=1081040 RepID=A0ABU0P3Z4_9MICO|nr:hypothetical protein [Microbacterium murale]
MGAAKELHDALEANGVTVWLIEKDVPLGTSLLGQIDKGLRMSRIGIVLVTPALYKSIIAEGIAQKELAALLATDRVIPVAHGTTFDELRDVSPLLGARSGLETGESPMGEVAAKIAEAVLLKEPAQPRIDHSATSTLACMAELGMHLYLGSRG